MTPVSVLFHIGGFRSQRLHLHSIAKNPQPGILCASTGLSKPFSSTVTVSIARASRAATYQNSSVEVRGRFTVIACWHPVRAIVLRKSRRGVDFISPCEKQSKRFGWVLPIPFKCYLPDPREHRSSLHLWKPKKTIPF